MRARRVVISGRVQGVGFRESLVEIATRAGLCGWVRNRADGTVEALLQGEAAAVATVVDWCRQGPAAARVTGLAQEDTDPEAGLQGFTRRPSA